jgi:probable F420-dependent oxidoreductase
MQVGWHLPHLGSWPGVDAIDAVADRAEELGFDSLWVADHVVLPTRIQSRYPYNESGAFGPGGGAWPWLDPLALLGYVAGRTRRVALGTSVLIVPYRHPLVLAKLVAGLDVLSRGRVLLGVGVGWMEDEFQALGIGDLFPVRGQVTDEYIAAMRAVWSADEASYAGKFVNFANVSALPRPVQQPAGPPIWVGGNGRAALRRAVRLGDGWQPYTLLPEEVASGGQQIAAGLAQTGRPADAVTISIRANVRLAHSSAEAAGWGQLDPRQVVAGTAAAVTETLRAYAAAGAQHMFFSAPGDSAATLDTMARFAREVLPALRDV